MKTQRDHTLDIMRGFAVFLMIQGNIAGGIYTHPYPTWVQWYVFLGSFVPALFILVSGMMVVYTTIHKGYTLKHYLIRAGGMLFAGAVILDMLIFGILPFTTVDVLYLIAIGIITAYYFQRLSSLARWSVVGIIFLATPFLQYFFGYTEYPTTFSVNALIHLFDTTYFFDVAQVSAQTSILQHWFIDGWFPIFPWLGFALLGVNLGIMRWKDKTMTSFATKKNVITAIGLIVFGLLLWIVQTQQLVVRGGFSEAIYPVTLAYISMAVGEILLFFALINWKTDIVLYKPLVVFGQSALFMYLFHFALMEFLWPTFSTQTALFWVIMGTLVSMLVMGYVLKWIRIKYHNRHYIFKILGV